jgi:hypothetical protein
MTGCPVAPADAIGGAAAVANNASAEASPSKRLRRPRERKRAPTGDRSRRMRSVPAARDSVIDLEFMRS